MRPTVVLMLAILSFASGQDADPETLNELLGNLATMGNTELVFISDFSQPAQIDTLELMSQADLPMLVYNLEELRAHQMHLPVEPCPIFGTGHGAGHGDEEDGHAEDHGAHAEGHDAHAEGHDAHAGGHDAHAEGHDAHAEGHDAHAEDDHGSEKWGDEGKADGHSGHHHNEGRPTKMYARADPVIHIRDQLIPSHRFHKSVFVWTEKTPVDVALKVFNDTVMWCDQKIDVGIFHHKTRYVNGFFLPFC